MAIVTAYKAIDMSSNGSTWYGSVLQATSTSIVISDGYRYGYYTGESFSYNSTTVVSGTLTEYSYAVYGETYYRVTGASYPASEAADLINSNQANVLMARALSGNDTFLGSNYSDHLIGFTGNDTFTGGNGDDIIDGGDGVDTVTFNSTHTNYTVTKNANNFIVTSLAGTDGIDTTTNAEVLQFSDTNYIIAPTNSVAQNIALLYQGALGRTPDSGGLADWVNAASQLSDVTQSLGVYALSDTLSSINSSLSIASGFTQSTEFIAKYGSLSDTQFITQLYANILDRTPDSDGLSNWVTELNDGISREHVLVGFSASTEAINNATIGFVGQTGTVHDAWLFLS